MKTWVDAPMPSVRLVLASASPRRAALLREAGIEFDVMPAHVDESVLSGETPESYVRRVATAKALAIVPLAKGRLVLAADTTVVGDGAILAKPLDRADARRMLRLLSGKTHEVVTGIALATAEGVTTTIDTTRVEFRPLSDEEIAQYVSTGEPDDKAGAYAIQGHASRFVSRIEGSHSNVVGLPMEVVKDLLRHHKRTHLPRIGLQRPE